MTGAEELERFVEVACRRLNSRLAEPGHALHLMLERAPDEAGAQVERVCARTGNQAARLGLALEDVLEERARWLSTLLAAETMVLACWTRPACLTAAEARRGRKRLRARLKDWLPEPGESQCPLAVLDGLEARHRALTDTLAALFGETGIVAERLGDEEALRTVRVLVNGSDTTAPDWRPVTVMNDTPARMTEPPEIGAFPPPLAPQILIRDPVRVRAGIRIGGRLYGALDMTLGPRSSRPFAELMEGLAEAGLPCRFSILIEGGGLRRLGAAVARAASAFMAFSHPDSRAVRDAMRALAEHDAASRAVVRLRLGMLTWVTPEEGEDGLARRLGRLQQIAEGWGECVFSPARGRSPGGIRRLGPRLLLRRHRRARARTALRGAAPAARLPSPRPWRARGSSVNHIFRAPDGKMLPWSCEEGEDHGFELIHGIPGRGKSVLMNSLTLAHVLQSGQASLPLAATIDIGPSSSGLISLIREALPPERRAEAGWFPLRMSASHAINPCDTQLGCRSPLPAERAFLENLLGLILTPAGAAGVPDGMRELIGPTVSRAYALRSDAVAGAEPNLYTPGRDRDVDEALERSDLALLELPWWEVVDALFDAGDAVAASRAQRYAVPVLGDFLAAVREPAVAGAGRRCRARARRRDRDPGLHPHPHRALPVPGPRCSPPPPSTPAPPGWRRSTLEKWPPEARPRPTARPQPSTCSPGTRSPATGGSPARTSTWCPNATASGIAAACGRSARRPSASPSTSSTAPAAQGNTLVHPACAPRWRGTPARRASTGCASASPRSATRISGPPWWSSPTASGCWGRAARRGSWRRFPDCSSSVARWRARCRTASPGRGPRARPPC